MTILQANSYSIGQKSGEICTGQVNLQPISFKSDRLLDLVEVAIQMHADNKLQFENWLISGMVGKVSDEQAAAWLAADAEVWAVVVSPWILVQQISQPNTH